MLSIVFIIISDIWQILVILSLRAIQVFCFCFCFFNEVSGVFWEPQQAHEQAREDAVAQLVNMQSNSGWSALMTAAWAGDTAVVQLLLRSGAENKIPIIHARTMSLC